MLLVVSTAFLERAVVSRQKLQLVGATALLLASKYEEVFPMQANKLTRHLTDEVCKGNEVVLSTMGLAS